MIGMIYALYLSQLYNEFSFDLQHYIDWILSIGYDLSVPEELSFDTLLEGMTRDKKSQQGKPVFVLLTEIGKPELVKVSIEDLRKADHFIRKLQE